MPDSSEQLMYLCGGEIDAGEFCLRISSEDLDPGEVSGLLGLQATESNRRGDPLGKRGLTYKFGQWRFSTGRLDFRAGKSCEEFFDEFMRSLPGELAVWERITERHEAEVYISLWMRTWNRDFDISSFAIGELARRKLRLHVDTYLDVDDEDESKA
jgi:hypothetical protein